MYDGASPLPLPPSLQPRAGVSNVRAAESVFRTPAAELVRSRWRLLMRLQLHGDFRLVRKLLHTAVVFSRFDRPRA